MTRSPFFTRDTSARLDDAAGALVAEHHAGRDGDVAAHDRQVRVADPARPDLDDDVARAGWIRLHLLERQGGGISDVDGSFH